MPLNPNEIDEILKREATHDCGGVGEKKICVRIGVKTGCAKFAAQAKPSK